MRWPWIRRACLLGALLTAQALSPVAYAQVESREGIALQNQLYQLRQDLQLLRSDVARGAGSGGGGGGGDIAAQLLSRVQAMEEQVRQLRGRIDETQNLIARQSAELSKRIDDLTFQFNLQGRGGASPAPSVTSPGVLPGVPSPPQVREVAPRPGPDLLRGPDTQQTREAAPRPPPDLLRGPEPTPRADLTPRLVVPPPLPSVIPPPPAPPQSFTFNPAPEPMREGPPPPSRLEPTRPPPPKVVTPPPAAADNTATDVSVASIPPGGKRTPEMALQEGHAALARRDYASAERSAREVMGNRASPRAYDGQFLLAESLAGQKQFAQAAIAYDDAYNRSHKGRYAQEALVGLAGALTSINEKKAACDTLGRLRTEFPQVRADLRDTITRTNDRAGCGR